MKHPSGRSFVGLRLLFWGSCLCFLLAVFFTVRLMFFPLLLGLLLAMLLQPAVEVFQRLMSRRVAIVSVFGLFAIWSLMVLWLVIPTIFEEVRYYNQNKERYLKYAVAKVGELRASLDKRYPGLIPWERLESFFQAKNFLSASWFWNLKWVVSNSLEFVLYFVLMPPLFAFFFLQDGPVFKRLFLRLVPNRYFELVAEMLHQTGAQVVGFLRGQMLDSAINAALLSICLSMIGLPYAILVGCFGGVANAVPIIGPMVAGLLALTIALVSQGPSVWFVLLVFGVIHLLDVMFIYPRTVGHSVHLHEMVVIVGVLVGGHWGGIVGMLIAVPVIGIFARSLQIMYRTLHGYGVLR